MAIYIIFVAGIGADGVQKNSIYTLGYTTYEMAEKEVPTAIDYFHAANPTITSEVIGRVFEVEVAIA